MRQFLDSSRTVLPDTLSTQLFRILFGISQGSGALMIILATIWMEMYGNDGVWTAVYFRFHPVLMTFAKWTATVAHAIVHSCAIFVMCLGAFSVWTTYTSIDEATTTTTSSDVPYGPQPFLRYYSFHTWLGTATITLYIMQYIGGILIYTHHDTDTRRVAMPFHQLMGVIVFGAVIITTCFGISQQASWKSICKASQEVGQHILSNIFATLFLVFCMSVILLLCNPRWKREKQ
ncbi:hypothetical protein GCK32_001078 [Trichostrongylus colubriformis]|uniref:Cytochrome b561 domain-containing protein n=1 Tax=Trichostrongylus colubriformis TaxID=6319 RepID=A0AAN8G5T4_TRICO